MKRILKNYRLSENIEALFMLMLGIAFQMTDGSPFSIKEKWLTVWETELPVEQFRPFTEKFIKTILSSIVIIRCLTTYVYVVTAMLVIFCILKDSAPKLMLLWLLVAAIKSIAMTFLEALIGVYVCSGFGNIRKACVEFFISKALEIMFATYLWGSLLSIYRDMVRRHETLPRPENWEEFLKESGCKRPRARSLLDESALYKTACLNNFEFKDVPQIILQMLRTEEQMSQDSLVGSGMMLASVSNFGSYDDLKTSQSLGELGLLDMKSIKVAGIEEGKHLSPADKALKFLKLNRSDVRKAQEDKKIFDNDVYLIDEETWTRVKTDHVQINKPKQPRPKVVMHEFPCYDGDTEELKKTESRKRSIELKFGFSLFSFLREKEELHKKEEEQLSAILSLSEDEEEGEDDDFISMFMSNIREEVAVNRIRLDFVSKKIKRGAYEKLYKEDYMSIIGPEVFDKATRLPKVTTIQKYMDNTTAKISASVPEFPETIRRKSKKINFECEELGENCDSISQLSGTGNNVFFHSTISQASLDGKTLDASEISLEKNSKIKPNNKARTSEKLQNRESVFVAPFPEPLKPESLRKIQISRKRCFSNRMKNKDDDCRCYRKNKIQIKRARRLTSPKEISLSNNLCEPRSIETSSSRSQMNETYVKNTKKSFTSMNDDSSECSEEKECICPSNKQQIYFVTKLLEQPFSEVLSTYYDLQSHVYDRESYSRVHERKKKLMNFCRHVRPNENTFSMRKTRKRTENKIWKSKVLGTATTFLTMCRVENDIRNSYNTVKEQITNFNNRNRKQFIKNKISSSVFNRCHLQQITSNSAKNVENVLTQQCKIKYGICDSNSHIFVSNKSAFSLDDPENHFFDSPNLNSSTLTLFSGSDANDYESMHQIRAELKKSDIIKSWVNSAYTDSPNNVSSDNSPSEILKKESPGSLSLDAGESIESNSMSRDSMKKEDVAASSHIDCHSMEDESSCSRDSEEPFSLYYSKTADLASPLLDMKRFIYPDHIHYSYKHVNKEGFDIDINGGLPLLVRESLTMNSPVSVNCFSKSENSQSEIIRRPMDLSFASSNAFTEWQTNDPGQVQMAEKSNVETQKTQFKKDKRAPCEKKSKKQSRKTENPETLLQANDLLKKRKMKYHSKNNSFLKSYTGQDYSLIEKVLALHKRLNSGKNQEKKEHPPLQISSTQLHSNKGRVNSIYSPAISLNKNKTRHEKRKAETQEERTKDMFARLEREVLLQSKNVNKRPGAS